MHITSLPSNYGIGTFGEAAYEFIDFLAQSKQSFWQILPLGMTGYGNSPYQSPSAFAGNINFIDLDILIEKGYLKKNIVTDIDWGKSKTKIDYNKIYQNRTKILKIAAKKFSKNCVEYEKFLENNDYWLNDFSIFMAIKETYGMVSFDNWDVEYIKREKACIDKFIVEHNELIDFYKITQFWFFEQFFKLKKYANENNIKIIGDIPFYVAYDSADVWASPNNFELDENYLPINVAGVPPDAFSDDGQLWGNPLYNYAEMRKNDYGWWKQRIEFGFSLCDVLRIDHFRAFDSYYAIPFGNVTAKSGEWRMGEGIEFFKKLNLLDRNIIAEDLGEITQSVRALIKATGYPNMKVLQFAFDTDEANEFLPHNYTKNCVVYTGTHDNNTTRGWYRSANAIEKKNVSKFVPYSKRMKKTDALIKYAFSSIADTVIIPLQDYLNLDEKSRMNTPSTLFGNWEWRVCEKDLGQKLSEKIIAFSCE